jgi:hypothetical protein
MTARKQMVKNYHHMLQAFFLDFLTLEDGTNRLSQNACKEYNTLHNNVEKHRSQYHYFGGWVGLQPRLDILAKRKPLSLMRIESRSKTIIFI